ncbi:recombinase family protein, partial [bacterium]|nr:recombinase family protein [bacterium]
KWIEDLADEKKPKKTLIFKDEGISGKTTNRPGLQAMLNAAYTGKIDTIVVYRLDRLSRNATTAIKMILNLDEAGVAFISVSQAVLNLGHENPFRRTMLAAFAEIAEIERETIVARVKAGLEAAKKRGVKLGAPKKYDQEKLMKAHSLRKEGMSFRKISKEIGVSLGTVSKMLKEEVVVESTESEQVEKPGKNEHGVDNAVAS